MKRLAKLFDVHPRTASGGVVNIWSWHGGLLTVVTVLGTIGAFTVFAHHELADYSTLSISRASLAIGKRIDVAFDITVSTSCSALHFDMIDSDGTQRLNVVSNISRIRIAESGELIEDVMERIHRQKRAANATSNATACRSCYGAGECCKSCYDIMQSFKARGWSFLGADAWEPCREEGYLNFGRESCRMSGNIRLKRGRGYFHLGLGKNGPDWGHGPHVITGYEKENVSHWWHLLRFGNSTVADLTDLKVEVAPDHFSNYFVSVVPVVSHGGDPSRGAYDFVVNYAEGKGSPLIELTWKFTPVMVERWHRSRFYTLLIVVVRTLGVGSGLFALASLFDGIMFAVARQRRLEVKNA